MLFIVRALCTLAALLTVAACTAALPAPTSAPTTPAGVAPPTLTPPPPPPPIARAPTPSPSPSPPPPPVIVRVGLPAAGTSGWAYYAAERMGAARRHNVRVEVSYHDSGEKTLAALTNGAVDLAGLPTAAALAAAERGAAIKLVAAQQGRPARFLLVGRDVREIEDLRGRPVAIAEPRDTDTALLKRLLTARGVRESDARLVSLGESDRRAAGVANGTVAAALLPPERTIQFADLGFRLAANAGEVTRTYVEEALVVRSDWPARNELALLRFLRALAEAQAWLNEPANRQAAIAALADGARLPARDAERAYQLVIEQAQAVPKAPDLEAAAIRTVLEVMAEAELLKPPLPAPEKHAELGYAAKARTP